jgi:hypothetical protein
MFNSEKPKMALVLILLVSLIIIGFGTAFAAPNAGPEVSIPSNISAFPNSIVSIPVNFATNGFDIASLAFSVDYDETWLSYDGSLTDIFVFDLPSGISGSCNADVTDTDGEIDCVVFDPMPPMAPIPDGTFLTIKLRTLDAPNGTNAPVNFSSDPIPSYGNLDGQSEPGTSVNGSVQFGDVSWFSFLPLLLKQTAIPTTVTPTPDTPTPGTPTPGTPTPETPTPETPTPETPTPVTPTPTPGCVDLIVNGDVEDVSDERDDGEGWELPATSYTASFSNVKVHSGVRSILTGIFDIEDRTSSYSSATQIVTIPSNINDAILTFWNYPRSGETSIQRLTTYLWTRIAGITPNSPLAFDLQYVAIQDLTAGTSAEIVYFQISNSREWEKVELDLSAYAGHTITLWFTTYNDNYDGVTSMFIDDVSLEVCE